MTSADLPSTEAAGLPGDATSLPRTTDVVLAGMERGLHVGASLYVSCDGIPIGQLDLGSAGASPATPRTAYDLSCATKPFVAVAVALLVQRGLVAFGDPVARYVPAFTGAGRDTVTLHHLLTHTAGFVDDPVTRAAHLPWAEMVRTAAGVELLGAGSVGNVARYSGWTAWTLLGEVIRVVDGRLPAAFLRDEVLAPLGLADTRLSYDATTSEEEWARLSTTYLTEGGRVVALDALSDRRIRQHTWAGTGATATMTDLGRFYEHLLRARRGEDDRLLDPSLVRLMTTPRRAGMYDDVIKFECSYGYGFDTDPRTFMLPRGVEVFGHGGHRSVVAYAEPATGLAVAFVLNGRCDAWPNLRRVRRLLNALYADLGLTRNPTR